MGKLTAIAVKAALGNPGTYQDGDGLFLKVNKRDGAGAAHSHMRAVPGGPVCYMVGI